MKVYTRQTVAIVALLEYNQISPSTAAVTSSKNMRIVKKEAVLVEKGMFSMNATGSSGSALKVTAHKQFDYVDVHNTLGDTNVDLTRATAI